jgi:hypothetical protein
MKMRMVILSCAALFLMGISAASRSHVLHSLSNERGFTRKEAKAKIGRRVRVADCSSLKLIGKRRDDPDGGWLDLAVGERGTVKKLEKVAPNEYYLIVYWDNPKERYPYRSYYRKAGRFSVYSECLAEG